LTLGLTPEAAFWAALGFVSARAFGKRFDRTLKSTRWFRRRGWLLRGLLAGLLDACHHWELGLLLWFYAPPWSLPTGFNQPLQWLGLGLFVDDMPDVPTRFRRYFSYLSLGGGAFSVGNEAGEGRR